MTSISIGPFALMTSTALLFASILLYGFLVSLFAKVTKYRKLATDILFFCLVVGFLVARVAFVIEMWEIYQKDWIVVFDIRDGGFNRDLGLFAGMIMLLFKTRGHHKLAFVYIKSAVITGVIIFPFFLVNTLMQQQIPLEHIAVTNIKGEPQSLSLKVGKPLIINFWASWCPPCRREMPVLQAAQQDYEQVSFIFVNQGEAPSRAHQFLQENGIQLHNLYFDLTGKTASQLGAYGLPATLFFDAEGNIVNSHMGELSEASLHHYLKPFLSDSQ
ncbi:TlpA disulfide reductase family protein [Alteromonas sp. 14N.309.X.WAT.G.H12]|uniref:TlpA disulfide reductase family protein n=1 Tax=Alteromonas sp. 14N.309.X.WAT.G.H12 TaxID=3120824 RepID=UPI002FD6DD11